MLAIHLSACMRERSRRSADCSSPLSPLTTSASWGVHCRHHGLTRHAIPSWEPIRARPQHNPVHRHTVDRHLVQTVAEVQQHLTRVERPDILLLTCLFHDIGKLPGAGVHHAERGAPIAREAVAAIGLNQPDCQLVELLVRHHLTLAALATKRDHADPATLDALVEAVHGRADILNLLRYLTEADARAAGPAAWSPWR